LADFLEREKVLGIESAYDQRVEFLMLITAIDFVRDDLISWAREGA
jgi:hypothetical protein